MTGDRNPDGKSGGRISDSTTLVGCVLLTVVLIVLIETGRRSGTPVPIPFLLLYVSVVLSAGAVGQFAGATSGVLAAAYVVYAGKIGFGPRTLTGGEFQIVAGCLLYIGTGYLIGRVRGHRDEYLVSLLRNEVELEREIDARTSELSNSVEALRSSEERHRTLLELIPEGIMVHIDGVIVFANPALVRMLGADSADEVIGRQAIDFVPEHDRANVLERRRSATGLLRVYLRETVFQRLDGSLVAVERAVARIDWQGRPAFLVLSRDIGERKRAEQALRASEAQLRLVTNNVPAMIAYIDRDYIVRFANKPYADYSELSQDEIVGKHLRDVRGREAFEESRPYISRTLAGEVTSNEGMRRHPGGTNLYFRATRVPHFDDAGAVLGYFIVMLDLTEHHQREEQIRQAQKMESMGTLAGGVAHELNNILMPIRGLTELAMEDLPEGSAPHRNLTYVLQSARRAAELVDKILSFSRQEPDRRGPVDLRVIVDEQLTLLRSALPATIRIRREIDEAPLVVLADETQIHQVLMNLASNAAHAIDGKVGELTMGLSAVDLRRATDCGRLGLEPGSFAKISIKDTGHGMDPDTAARIFEPFFTTKRVGEGTGMGLAVIHGIVAAYGGAIDVTTERGVGTTFDVYLPLASRPEAVLAATG